VQPSFLGTDNRELIATIEGDPQLRGVAVLDPRASGDDIALLHRAGVRGIRLNLVGVGDFGPYATPEWQSLFSRIHSCGWHVEIHTDAGRFQGAGEFLMDVRAPIVLDHFGKPDPVEGLDCPTFEMAATLSRKRPVYVKFSAGYRLGGMRPTLLARKWIDVLGEDALLWGSDWPWTQFEGRHSYADCLAMLSECVQDAGTRRKVLAENPARLFDF
jgi:predicted TIM-barrel fold metal-dependent hydrolase